MARILVGVTGGIAAYKALETVRLLLKAGHAVRVLQTHSATRFVGPASFAGVTGAPVLSDEWEPDLLRGAFPGDPLPAHAPLSHLALVERADLFLIAPTSANTVAKLAHGIADNLLCAAALACRRPLLLAPAMNGAMYEHPATQANLELLRTRGAEVLEPGTGSLGSPGEWGVGRLPEPAELVAACESRLAAGGALDGLRVLVTAGGTREPVDAVRYVGNRSSGRMGVALASAARRRGATVCVIAANVALVPPAQVEWVPVETAAELATEAQARFAAADVLLMAAAVADYRPAAAVPGKLSKGATGERLLLELERTDDVLASLAAQRRPGQLLVGFAAEHGPGAVERARAKLERKGLDAVVVNDVSVPGIAFEAPENEVTVVTPTEEHHLARAAKPAIAAAILDLVLRSGSSPAIRVAG